MDIEKIDELVSASEDDELEMADFNKIAEVCLIGLAAYFEAYCKNQFAALINICPQLLENFTVKRENVTINLKDIISMSTTIDYRLGCLLAEEYDFGSAKTINNLFFDLMGITLFSRKEAKRYGEFLEDRNLLVHHGGIYTLKYRQRFQSKPDHSAVHWNSLIIGKRDFQKWSKFIHDLVKKINAASHRALEEFLKTQGIDLPDGAKRATEMLIYEDLVR